MTSLSLLFRRLDFLLKKKLIIPLLRSPHSAEYKAKGVGVGLAWAMTPLVGIQMWLVFMTWIIAKKVFRWHFSLALGMAWTWITNVFTLPPIYYLFYVTGQLLRGNFSSIGGYQNLKEIIEKTFLSDLSFIEQWLLFFKLLLQDWGISMMIGCIPFAIFFGFLGYRMTLTFEQKRLKRKLLKQRQSNGTIDTAQ